MSIAIAPPGTSGRRGAARAAARTASWALCVAALVIGGAMVAPVALGLERYVITGDSMSGTYERGSILYAQEVPVDELHVGDVITYDPPPRAGVDGLVTHRIVAIDERGRDRVFRTKGDANARPDSWRFRLDGPVQSRASFAVPWLGYAIAALAVREVRIAVIGVPALAIATAILVGLWTGAGREARRRVAASTSAAEPGS